MSEQNTKKSYNPSLGSVKEFFTPHQDANCLNAQDIVFDLVTSAKNISITTWNFFEDGKELVVKDEIIANLIVEIQTKLEMIEKLLPLAFEYEESKKAVSP